MGFVPIVVAIFGFVLLWAVVNYNSLLARREQLISMQREQNELEKQHSIFLAQLQQYIASHFSDGTALSQQWQQLAISSGTQTNNLITQIRQANVPSHPEAESLLNTFADINARLNLLKRNEQLCKDTYNKLVTKMPSRIVAVICGFKAITGPIQVAE